MPDPSCLRVGPLQFSIQSSEPVVGFSVPQKLRPFYPHEAHNASDIFNIPVKVQSVPQPFKAPGDRRYHGPVWQAFKEGNTRYVQSRPSAPPQRAWTAIIEGHERIDFLVSQTPVNRPDSEPGLLNPLLRPTDQLLMGHVLTHADGIFVHSAGIAIDNTGYLCVGTSETGKSTFSEIAHTCGGCVLSDERIAVRCEAGTWRMYGTPWPGTGGFSQYGGIELRHILFLTQSDSNKALSINHKESLKRLIPTVTVHWHDEDEMTRQLSLIDALLLSVPCYDFHFTRTPDAFRAIPN